MNAPSRWLPFILIGLGIVLVAAAFVFPLVIKTDGAAALVNAASTSAPIPTQMAGLPLSSEATGNAAIQEFTRLHGKSFPVTSGAKAVYGSGGQAILWVAGTPSSADSRKLLEEMRDKIAQGQSPFQPSGVQTIANREVYALDGMGQKHFYFQSGKYLVWLAANTEVAEQALQQALNFYP